MIVYAVYVVGKNGTPMISETFQAAEDLPDEFLLSGLFSALQSFSDAVVKQAMRTIHVEGLSFHIQSFDLYTIVLVTDQAKKPDEIINTLGMRFMKLFGDVLVDEIPVSLNTFEPFRSEISEVVGSESTDSRGMMKPAKKLTTVEIFELPSHLHQTALAILSLERFTVGELAAEVGLDVSKVEGHLAELAQLGFLGQRDDRFFCSIE